MCVCMCIDGKSHVYTQRPTYVYKYIYSSLNWYFVKLILMKVLVSILGPHIQMFGSCLI